MCADNYPKQINAGRFFQFPSASFELEGCSVKRGRGLMHLFIRPPRLLHRFLSLFCRLDSASFPYQTLELESWREQRHKEIIKTENFTIKSNPIQSTWRAKNERAGTLKMHFQEN